MLPSKDSNPLKKNSPDALSHSDALNPVPDRLTDSGIFRLQGKVLKQWWQVGDAFRIIRDFKAPFDRYENIAIRSPLTFLLTLPFGMAILYHCAGSESIRMLILAGGAALVMAIHMVLSYRQHCKIAVEVKLTEIGITIKSPLMPARNIGWGEISDFFEVQNGDYVLLTTRGEDYLLTSDLSNSEILFKRIKELCGRKEQIYKVNTRIPNSFIDGGNGACLAIVVASLFPVIQILIYRPGLAVHPGSLIFAAIVCVLAVLFVRFQSTKLAELVRFGQNGISVRTRDGKLTELNFQDIKRIKKFGSCYLVSSRKGLFVTILEKTDSAEPKMIELKNTIGKISKKV